MVTRARTLHKDNGVEVKDGLHPAYVNDSKARFNVLPPSPLQGVTAYGILDRELAAVIAFAPVEAQAIRIVVALNEKYSVGGKR